MEIALHLFTAIVVIATLLPYSRVKHWIVRSLDFPRVQIFTCTLTVLFLQLWILDIDKPSHLLPLIMILGCLIVQGWWIAPYTPAWPLEVMNSHQDLGTKAQLSILTANVYTPNRNVQALLDLVDERQPDILVTLESDQWWEDQLNVLEEKMPYSIKCPLDNLYGMHVYSSIELHDGTIEFLVENQVPSMHASILLTDHRAVQLHFVHPAPPSPTENTESIQRDAELIMIAQRITSSPTIVTGDLNDVAWSSTTRLFRKISGLLDPRVGRGMFNTFHASYPFMRWPLDHVFHSHHFTLKTIARLTSIGSDHFPLFTTLHYSPENNQNEAPLESTNSDQERANTILDQVP